MGFILRKRLKTGKGFGLNLSKTGISASHIGKYGSIGTKGFSVRTGVKGINYRSYWGKKGKKTSAFMWVVFILFTAYQILGEMVGG